MTHLIVDIIEVADEGEDQRVLLKAPTSLIPELRALLKRRPETDYKVHDVLVKSLPLSLDNPENQTDIVFKILESIDEDRRKQTEVEWEEDEATGHRRKLTEKVTSPALGLKLITQFRYHDPIESPLFNRPRPASQSLDKA